MKEFFEYLFSSWWGITTTVIVGLILFVLISALLYRPIFKRFYDIVLSAIAIIVLSPLLIVLTILGAIKMKGNPFFTQLRPGKINKRTGKEKIFKLIKFRTMTMEKDENGNLLPDKKRLTKYGQFLRSTSLDELPELFNIFIGNMSIVGPRPLLVKYLPLYNEFQARRHEVTPGLTGLAQVKGRNSFTWEQRFELDIKYVDTFSLMGDLSIILGTIIKVFKKEGISSDSCTEYTMQEFTGTKEIMNTPYFLIKKEKLDLNITEFRDVLKKLWPNSFLSYSVKTNSLPWLLRYIKDCGHKAEVVSDEEYELAKLAGFKGEEIVFNGPIKSPEMLKKAVADRSYINIDSMSDVETLAKIKIPDTKLIGIRVNVDPRTFEQNDIGYVEDGFRFGFGVDNGEFKNVVDRLDLTGKEFGLHLHCNSVTRNVSVYRAIIRFAVKLIKEYSLTPSFIDVGGGFAGGVLNKPSAIEYITAIKEELKGVVDIRRTTLIIEPGSAIIGSAVEFHTSVLDVKDTGFARIVTTDGSRIHLDPLWKKSKYVTRVESGEQNQETHPRQIICGYTCMDHDRITVFENQKELHVGDRIVYTREGAYSMTLGGLFIRFLCDVYVEDNDKTTKVRSKMTANQYFELQDNKEIKNG